MAAPAAVLSIFVHANTGSATRGLIRFNQRVGETEKQSTAMGRAIGTAMKVTAVAVGAVGAASAKLAIDFDKSMRNVNSIAQLPEKQFGKLEKQVLGLAGKTAQAPKTLADGLYDLVSSGFNARQSMVILSKSAKAATAGLTDTATSTKAVAAVLNAYHLQAKDAGKVSDTLFETVNRGVLTFEELAQTVGDVLPFASALHVNLNQVGAATSTMTKEGINAFETMTRLKNVLQSFIKPSEGMANAIKRTGFESGEALVKAKGLQGALEAVRGTTDGSKEAVAKLFPNIRALSGALALTGGNAKSAHGDLKAFGDTAGATNKALSQQAKSVSYQWNRLKAQTEAVAISLGTAMLPALIKVIHALPVIAEHVKNVVHWFQRHKTTTDALIVATASLAAGFAAFKIVATITTLIAAFRTAFIALDVAMTANPIGVIVAALAALAVGLVIAYKRSETFRKIVNGVFGAVKKVALGFADAFLGVITTMLGGIEKMIRVASHIPIVGGKFKGLADDIHGARVTMDNWREGFRKSIDASSKKADQMSGKVADLSKRVTASVRTMRVSSGRDLDQMAVKVTDASRRMLKDGGANSKATQQAVSTQFALARKRVRQAMDDQVVSARQGFRMLHKLATDQLALYGIKAGRVNVVLAKGANGQMRPNQRGGHINEGAPSGDSVPAMLERGEYVLNRNAVRKVGKHALDRLNFNAASRFQQGGMAGLKPGIASAVRSVLGHFPGLMVTSTTGGHHAPGSYHYLGEAADIAGPPALMNRAAGWIRAMMTPSLTEGIHNPNLSVKFGRPVSSAVWGAQTWAAHANHIHLAVAGMLKALGMPDIARVVLSGPPSVATEAAQGALDRVRGAARASLMRAVSMMGGGPESDSPVTTGGQFGKQALMRLWTQAGGSPSMAHLMAAVALAESGGNPSAHNPSGATGLWQILGNPFPGNAYDPLTNARMAVSKLRSQGLGAWEAYTNGSYRNFLQRGGMAGMRGGGGIGRQLHRTLRAVRTKSPRLRHVAVRRLLDKIRGVGLPNSLSGKLKTLSQNADIFADYADRANTISTTDANGNTVGGVVFGKGQAGWLQDELGALFQWRNAILRAEEIITERRKQLAKLIKDARKRMRDAHGQMRWAARTSKRLNDQLTTAQKHPKANRSRIKSLREKIHSVTQQSRVAGRSYAALHDRILPALTGRDSKLKDAAGTLEDILAGGSDSLQGVGSTHRRMKKLPVLGALGGRILDVQVQLRDLLAPTSATDNSGGTTGADTGTGDSGRADLLAQLLQQANLRYAVSQAQYRVFKDMPSFGGGGVVPGPQGAPRVVQAHGGEGFFTPDQMAAMGGGQPVVVVVEKGAGVDESKIRVISGDEAERRMRRISRAANRGLPSRGGGVLR